MTLLVSRLYSVSDEMINGYGAVGGMKFAEETEVLRKTCHTVHMTWPGIETLPPRWEAGI
jgi:hypothetical protein